ncbi:MAG: P63C domain-containing protein [Sulfitobacter sp.]
MTNSNKENPGPSKGGRARAEKLSPEERSAIAKQAAAKRWEEAGDSSTDNNQVLEGFKSHLTIAGTNIPCAIVMGPNGITRVLSDTGITNAVLGERSGASKRLKKISEADGNGVPIFLAPSQLKPFIGPDLLEGPLVPIDYLDGSKLVRGYDARILPAVCNVWLRAREAGALQDQQLDKAQKAEILTRALAETAIIALVDEATGYQSVRPQNALQSYLELVIQRELAIYAKKFPDEFYENIYKLKGWKWPGMSKNRFSVCANYTTNLIYDRLGPGITDELIRKTPKTDKGYRPNKLHQWLSEDIGDPMLATHMHSILMFQRLAIANGYGWKRFLNMVDQVLPRRGTTIELPLGYHD